MLRGLGLVLLASCASAWGCGGSTAPASVPTAPSSSAARASTNCAALLCGGRADCLSPGAPSSPSKPAPAPSSLASLNDDFHAEYGAARAQLEGSLGDATPVVCVAGAFAAWDHRGSGGRAPIVNERYRALRNLSHLPATAILLFVRGLPPDREHAEGQRLIATIDAALAALDAKTVDVPAELLEDERRLLAITRALLIEATAGARPDDARLRAYGQAVRPMIEANLAATATTFVGALHATVSSFRAAIGEPAWKDALFVVATAHQARGREISVRYFERLLGEPPATEGARTEGRIVVLEGTFASGPPVTLLATHALDRRLGALLFDDPQFLQRDVLGRFADAPLDALFPAGK